MEIYAWKPGTIYTKADAQKVGEEIYSLADKDTKEISTKSVVDKARDEDSAMHNLFEWNDEIAAEKYRERQAGNIIRSIVFVKTDQESGEKEASPIRVFYSQGHGTNAYKPTSYVVQNKSEYERLLAQAYEELRIFKKKYSYLSELDEIIALIN